LNQQLNMKKTLELTLCESEGVKIEVSCDVLRIETDNPATHPDDPNQGTVTEYWCKKIECVKMNNIVVTSFDNQFLVDIAYLVELQLESNPELFD